MWASLAPSDTITSPTHEKVYVGQLVHSGAALEPTNFLSPYSDLSVVSAVINRRSLN